MIATSPRPYRLEHKSPLWPKWQWYASYSTLERAQAEIGPTRRWMNAPDRPFRIVNRDTGDVTEVPA